jgi:hypothetical protein
MDLEYAASALKMGEVLSVAPRGRATAIAPRMTDLKQPSESLSLELVRVQRRIEAFYELEPAPLIPPFVRVDPKDAREQLLVRESSEGIDVVVLLPLTSALALLSRGETTELDAYLNAIEGVSHFIHLADRARTELPTTLLELELQAEVDKFAILAGEPGNQNTGELVSLHRRLYEDVTFLHASASELGQRYRLANELAARLWSQLIRKGPTALHRDMLKRFYRASQAEKISMVRAA